MSPDGAHAEPAVEPFLLLGQRRRAALEQVIAERVGAWRDQWSLSRETIHGVVIDGADPMSHSATQGGSLALAAQSPAHGPLVYLCAGPEALCGLLGMSGAPGEPRSPTTPHSVVHELELSLAQALCEELLRSAGVDDAIVDSKWAVALQEDERSRRYLSVVVSAAGRPRLALWLSPQLVELLVPLRQGAVAPGTLERRRAAIGSEPVRVEAVLGDVEVALRDLMQLATGDVIVLEQPLSSPGRLALPSGELIAKVQLGSAGRHRAVSIVK